MVGGTAVMGRLLGRLLCSLPCVLLACTAAQASNPPSPEPTRGAIAAGVALVGTLLLVSYWNHGLRRMVRRNADSLEVELARRREAEAALRQAVDRLEENVQERTRALQNEMAERQRSEQATRCSEQRFRALFQNLADPVYFCNEQGDLVAANDQACQELGYPLEELLSLSVTDIDVVHATAEAVSAKLATCPADVAITFESVHRRRDGTTFPVEMRVRSLVLEGQRAFLGVARNLFCRKEAEENRLHLERRLLQAQKLESLGVLAGGIAHDFNNLLMAIMGNAELALMSCGKSSPLAQNLHRIDQAAAQAAELTRHMLAYSGKGRFLLEHLDLNLLLEKMLPSLKTTVGSRAKLHLVPASLIPSIDADAAQIRLLVTNLVSNAAEAIHDLDGVITIATSHVECCSQELGHAWPDQGLAPGAYVVLEVSDNGCGMDPSTREKLFDPFFTTKFTGQGLGMAAALGIVRGHKGTVQIHSEVGRGSTLRIFLPATSQVATPASPPQQPTEWRGAGKVLLVDDEEIVRTVGCEMLNSLGYEVITADNGYEAVSLFRKQRDLEFVMLDLAMPRMDGEECFREMRRLNPSAKVIMTSGYSEQEISGRLGDRGLAGFLQKPYRLGSLKEVLRRVLGEPGAPAQSPSPT